MCPYCAVESEDLRFARLRVQRKTELFEESKMYIKCVLFIVHKKFSPGLSSNLDCWVDSGRSSSLLAGPGTITITLGDFPKYGIRLDCSVRRNLDLASF